ncbi:MAG: hypothetical protein U9N83_01425 [Thermodesulfobacteriota bacterium]|nr:hypothetical protein [Thermodesulfobacteriota bacterium]
MFFYKDYFCMGLKLSVFACPVAPRGKPGLKPADGTGAPWREKMFEKSTMQNLSPAEAQRRRGKQKKKKAS